MALRDAWGMEVDHPPWFVGLVEVMGFGLVGWLGKWLRFFQVEIIFGKKLYYKWPEDKRGL